MLDAVGRCTSLMLSSNPPLSYDEDLEAAYRSPNCSDLCQGFAVDEAALALEVESELGRPPI
jgi:hypothetical protein